jgi:glycine/D-amino acid oxidase-like deaminating enzyme
MRVVDFLIVGGGFYGLSIGKYFASKGKKVLILEREPIVMSRASANNQARVHNGYHYPRSFLTANRSHKSFDKFCNQYSGAIYKEFESLYAIPRNFSKVNSAQFKKLFDRIGSPIKLNEFYKNNIFNKSLIESVFSVQEYCFDHKKLREIAINEYLNLGGEILYNVNIHSVESYKDNLIKVLTLNNDCYFAKKVINSTYSNLNYININSGFDLLPIKHEMTEMILVKPPNELNGISITLMCGNFFSFMPFPSTGDYTLSHVRYTPHFSWSDKSASSVDDIKKMSEGIKSNQKLMIADSSRFVPLISKCEYQSSIWETKTVLVQSEVNDSRPILFKPHFNLKNYFCVMGGKIDNIFDIISEFKLDDYE